VLQLSDSTVTGSSATDTVWNTASLEYRVLCSSSYRGVPNVLQLSDSTVTGSSAADTSEYNSAVPGVD
jgi:hypothetical protein